MSCTLCELHKKRKNIVPGQGPIDAKIIIIGEAPSTEDDMSGYPFYGPNGRMLNSLLQKAGITRNEVYVTNVVKCFPASDVKPANKWSGKFTPNRAPTDEEVTACSAYLEEELSKLTSKKVIVPLGNVALKYIAGLKTCAIMSKRGAEFQSAKYNCTILPTLHPSSLIRAPKYETAVIEDLKKVKILASDTQIEKIKTNYIFIDTIEKLNMCVEDLKKSEAFSFDIETTGLDFWNSKTVTIAMSNAIGKAYFIPLLEAGGSEEPYWKENQEYAIKCIKEIMESPAKKIAQNAKFDTQHLRVLGIETNNLSFDTLLAHHLLNENAEGMHGLKAMAWSYTDMGGYDQELDEWYKANKQYKWQVKYVPLDMIFKYNSGDADATYRLYTIFEPMLRSEGLTRLFNQIVMPISKVLTDTEIYGIKYDVDYAMQLKQKCEDRMKDSDAKLLSILGEPINLKSPKQLSDALYVKMKLKPKNKTDKGSYSTDVNTLNELVALPETKANPQALELLEAILAHRKASKIVSTYIEGIMKRLDDKNRVHTDYKITGTVSGRLSSSQPNLQAITHDDEIRNLFVAEKGYKLLEVDLKAAEVRIWASCIKDQNLIADFKEGVDIYKKICVRVFHVAIEDVTEDQRGIAKGIVLGLMYGRGTWSIAEELKIPQNEAQAIVDSFFYGYPNSLRWMSNTKSEAKVTGIVRNPFGRIRRVPGINSTDKWIQSEAERQALNSPIQGGSADYTAVLACRVINRIKKEGLDGKLVLTVHDSLIFEIKDNETEKLENIIKEELDRPVDGILVPMAGSIKIGTRWSC